MRFKVWFENTDKSVRRKLAHIVTEYLGIRPNIPSFRLSAPKETIFGKEGGNTDLQGNIETTVNSAIHEILHQTGFREQNIGKFLNEGITQTTAEDIGEKFSLPVVKSYSENVEYVKRYVVKPLDMTIQGFARQYARVDNKGEWLVEMIWKKYGKYFSNEEDWGNNPKSSMLKYLPYIIGPWEAHLNFIDELNR